MLKFLAATGEHVLWVQLLGKVVEKICSLSSGFDLHDDMFRVLTHSRCVAIGFLARCDQFCSGEQDIFAWVPCRGIRVLITWAPSGCGTCWRVIDPKKSNEGMIERIVL